jgi:hypothetical protein
MRRRVFDHVDPYLAPPERDEPQPPDDRHDLGDAIRQALQLVRRAARSDYLGFSQAGDAAIEEATALLVKAALSETQNGET